MDNLWNFTSKIDPIEGVHKSQSLELGWFLNWDSISDDYVPADIPAVDLFSIWLKRVEREGDDLPISWWIPRYGESAPFTGEDEDFLTFYTWPTHAYTGQRLNWLTLPVLDKGWSDSRDDKGGFIQEVTGWKPSPLQPHVNLPTLLAASGWRQRSTGV